MKNVFILSLEMDISNELVKLFDSPCLEIFDVDGVWKFQICDVYAFVFSPSANQLEFYGKLRSAYGGSPFRVDKYVIIARAINSSVKVFANRIAKTKNKDAKIALVNAPGDASTQAVFWRWPTDKTSIHIFEHGVVYKGSLRDLLADANMLRLVGKTIVKGKMIDVFEDKKGGGNDILIIYFTRIICSLFNSYQLVNM
jgi:hypothetical protein